MNKPNFTHMIFSLFGARNVIKSIGAFSIVITLSLIFSQLSIAQDCNSTMACGKKVNISMDDDCNITIQPDVMTDDQAYPNDYYDVEARLNGQLLPSIVNYGTFLGKPIKRPDISRIYVGKTLEVKITLRGCFNSCWGYALIEDKLAPEPKTCPCVERITRFDGEINVNGPIYFRPLSSYCEDVLPTLPPQRSNFKVFQFAVSANGIVDINMNNPIPGPAPSFTLYRGVFNPNLPCSSGKLTNNLLSARLNLLAGVNYFLVVAIAEGQPINVPINVAIESTTGSVMPNADASVCSIECKDEVLLLKETEITAQNKPLFEDNCTAVTLTKSDEIESLGCESRFSKIIRRSWIAKDAYGNASEPKVQLFYVQRINLIDIICPPEVKFECADYPRLPNGAPDPLYTGSPTNLNCQNIQVYYDDVIFPLCGNSVKVHRTWNIIDWCSGEDKQCLQGIVLMDTKGPEITCPATDSVRVGNIFVKYAATVPVSGFTCIGQWPVLPPKLIKDCSKVTWEISFKKPGSLVGAPYVTIDGTIKVTGVKPAFASTISQSARPYIIENLPVGITKLKYTVTDECGNITECFADLNVADKTPPTAICHGTTVVAIDESAFSEVFAESLNDASYDNCGIVKYEIKRNTPPCAGFPNNVNFGPSIKVCCKDYSPTGQKVPVTLRVYDAAGNFNDCETDILIQLKNPPILRCPDPKEVSCSNIKLAAWASGTQAFDTVFFGRPVLQGICISSQGFSSRIIANNTSNKCGVGTIVREWTLVSNPTIKCQQTVVVVGPSFGSNNIVFPRDTSFATCNLNNTDPDITGSKPIVNSLACRDLGISFTDKFFYDVPGACVKIVRTWKIIDWCTYPTSNLVIEHTQKILLLGSEVPVFKDCRNVTLQTETNRCDIEATISARATDVCTDSLDIKYTWKIDLFKDGTFNANGATSRFTRVLEVGTHQVIFTAENRCGKKSECKFDVIVKSNKKPTPICLREVIWVHSSDTTEVWASDFNRKSVGSCGSTANLRYTFDEAGLQAVKKFTCADIPNGQVARIPLKMYVFDSFGNSDFCDVILILQDSPLNNRCRDISSLLPSVQGRIATEVSAGLEDVEVTMTNMQSSNVKTAITSNQGMYIFDGVDVFDPKEIDAADDHNHLNGVSTLDLVLIQRHILGINKINSPYKLLAADINNSRTITASDLVNLRKLILGVTLEFENNTSWRFVPESFTFADPQNPFDYSSKINLDSIFEDRNNVNFVAVKVGDINNSVVANAQDNPISSRTKNAMINYTPASYKQGEVVNVEIKAGTAMDIIGAQMSIKYDQSNLVLKEIESNTIDIKPGFYHAKDGTIKMSVDIPSGKSINADDVLFTLVFTAELSGQVELEIDEASNIESEVYDMMANQISLDLQVRNVGEASGQNILYQNEPNPFKENTKIAFELGKAGKAVVKVMDLDGGVIFNTSRQFEKGYNVVIIDAHQLAKSGVYYYQVEADGFNATKKMILIK